MAKRGLLLINLGSPHEPTTGAVRSYLNEFLTDPYVIDIPAPWRQLLVYGVISPTRSSKSAHAYQKIWRPEGSPLVHYTRSFADKLGRLLGSEFDTRWAMRYGVPSIGDVCENWNAGTVTVVPMYPQYALSSTQTAIDVAQKALGERAKFVEDFHAHPAFLDSQALVIQENLRDADHLLLSFHGLPEHHLTKMYPDHCLKSAECCAYVGPHNQGCYRAQSFATAAALRARLKFPADKITVSFQSRLGRRPWIKPYTDEVLPELVKSGVKRLAVSCPSFVADCLETLEEVQIRLREQFQELGGEELWLVPALNDDDRWVARFAELVREQ